MEKRTIIFNEAEHSYTDEYKIKYTSVTQLIHKVEKPYDSEYWSVYRSLEQAGYKIRPFPEERKIEVLYNGKRQKFDLAVYLNGLLPVNIEAVEVRQDWEDIKDTACRWGTTKHEYLEGNLNKIANTTKYSIDTIKENTYKHGFAFKVTNEQELEQSPLRHSYPSIYREILRFIKDGWTLFSEKRVYDAYYQIAGTIDVLLVKDGMCYIVDWKTNRKQLKFESGYYRKVWNADRTKKIETDEWIKRDDRLMYPLANVPACPGSIYTLQLSSYHFLCHRWGLKPVGTMLVHIRPRVNKDGEILLDAKGDRLEYEPEIYELPIWYNETKLLFDWHKSKLAA